MERHFERDMETLKDRLLLMGGRVEAIIHKAVDALEKRDAEQARQVFNDDRAIDRLEIEIEERCLSLLALQQPLARDLRFITAALKISNDLERVGDHAVNIAGHAASLISEEPLQVSVDLTLMAELATGMLREALDAFVRRDADTARLLVRRDDDVDRLNRNLFRELAETMCQDLSTVRRSLELILVARNLERVADLATNVAEEVVFIKEARIIKHHAEDEPAQLES